MALIAGVAVAALLLAGTAEAQTQPLPVPAADTPALPAPRDVDYPGTIDLKVDAADIDRHVIAVHEVVPVARAGAMVLLEPKWIPGTHSTEGDATKLAGLHIHAGGKEIPWTRDLVAMHAFHIDVPAGAPDITVDFQYLAPVRPADGVIVHTRNMMDLQLWSTSLYPAGYFTRRIPVRLTLTLPQGWSYGTALETDRRDGDVVTFKTIAYDNLIDSPVLAGRYFRRYDLDPGAKVSVHMDVVADYPDDLDIPDSVLQIHKTVVQQAYRLFGARHYDHYDFLVAVSDEMGGIGMEHHRSSEDAVEPSYFKTVSGRGFGRDILPHEYTHSWDGKFRRPQDQFIADFQQPMRDDLMWVYEGGTEYFGDILESRSGLYSFDQRLQILAARAALYDTLPARQWRNLQETNVDPVLSNRGPKSWPSWQRSEDYYDEGALMWLDADTLIREKTGGKKSLDDFAKAFFGMDDLSYLPLTYTFGDVVKALDEVYPYDWAAFLRTRLDRTGGGAPLDGIARGGYRLVYTDAPTDYIRTQEARRGPFLTYSLGFGVGRDGTVTSVLWGGPAFKAGLTAGKTIIAVNGRAYDGDRLKDVITADAAPGNKDPIELLVKDGDYYRTLSLDYHGGLRYPKLVRIDGAPDRLRDIYQEDGGKSH
jgi:predicted metalloprotease with PDZ domain